MFQFKRALVLFPLFLVLQETIGNKLGEKTWYLSAHLAYYDQAKLLCIRDNEGELATIKTHEDGQKIAEILDMEPYGVTVWVGVVRAKTDKCSASQTFNPVCWKWSDGTDVDTSIVNWDTTAYEHYVTSSSRVYFDYDANALFFDKSTEIRRYLCGFDPKIHS